MVSLWIWTLSRAISSSGLFAAIILPSLTTLSKGTYGCHNLSP